MDSFLSQKPVSTAITLQRKKEGKLHHGGTYNNAERRKREQLRHSVFAYVKGKHPRK